MHTPFTHNIILLYRRLLGGLKEVKLSHYSSIPCVQAMEMYIGLLESIMESYL